MKNIWFIRTDKDKHNNLDTTEKTPFIYSLHGVCGDKSYIIEHKNKVFPELKLSKNELILLVKDIKGKLVANNIIDPTDDGKIRCDFAILYWLAIMEEGDIVFVRNKKQEVLVCKVTGYVSESFFDTNLSFQRPVKVLGHLTKEDNFEKIRKRTLGRKTIERNGKNEIRILVSNLLQSLNI